MNVVKIVFSPTGGTQKVADALAEELAKDGGSISQIDLSDPAMEKADPCVDADALAVIAAPCFAGRVPALVLDRLAKVTSNGAKAVVTIVYGNRDFDDALLELKDSAVALGYTVVAGVAGIAEHSLAHQFATGEPGPDQIAMLHSFAQQILEKVQNGATGDVEVPGNKPYKEPGAGKLVSQPTPACSACRACAQVCPVGAIGALPRGMADENLCIGCMRCAAVCPKHARVVNQEIAGAIAARIESACSVKKDPQLFL